MDNIARAKEGHRLANKVEKHKGNIERLKNGFKCFVDGEKATITVSSDYNQTVRIEADEDLFNSLILAEEGKLDIAEQELNELLNGDIDRIKAYLEGKEYGTK